MTPDPQLIERVAQAMDNAFPGLFRSQEECQDVARAAIQATLTDPKVAAATALADMTLLRLDESAKGCLLSDEDTLRFNAAEAAYRACKRKD